jgi:hypothetical protein
MGRSLSLGVCEMLYKEEGGANNGEEWSCIDELMRRK